MIQFTGLADCADKDEASSVIRGLMRIPDVKFDQSENRVEAYYMPDAEDTDSIVEDTVRKIINILEVVEVHGFSIISKRR